MQRFVNHTACVRGRHKRDSWIDSLLRERKKMEKHGRICPYTCSKESSDSRTLSNLCSLRDIDGLVCRPYFANNSQCHYILDNDASAWDYRGT